MSKKTQRRNKMTELEKLIAREELKTLVDNYATELDRNNQDYYVRELFH